MSKNKDVTLIVSDYPVTQSIMASFLADIGYKPTQVTYKAEAAITHIRHEPVQLVVIEQPSTRPDVVTPIVESIEEAVVHGAGTWHMLVVADNPDAMPSTVRKHEWIKVLAKPFTVDQLKATLDGDNGGQSREPEEGALAHVG